jgi:hypothetical protein
VTRRAGRGREILWRGGGAPHDLGGRLRAAGATVRETSPMTLDEAAIALLASEESR